MSKRAGSPIGNILGAARAEADSAMLSRAFIETADYRALIETRDFNYVVGRRGTGKSALFSRVKEHFKNQQHYFLLAAKPEEFETLQLQKILSENGQTYLEMRAISRLAWKIHILLWVFKQTLAHYKMSKFGDYSALNAYAADHAALLENDSAARCTEIIRVGISGTTSGREIPGKLAGMFRLNQLQNWVRDSLEHLRATALIFYDGLDEGWLPNMTATAVLGGLSLAIADLSEGQSGIHSTIFVRDNMFRALAYFDGDFSRHIEGHSLRLHWNEDSLFQLIANRLRVVLNLGGIESGVKVWNRFAATGVEDRSGFELCLRYTLYRLRDILVLLNQSYVNACREGRDRIIESDVEAAAKTISHDRLEDLLKEYDEVLPGLKSFVRSFENRLAFDQFEKVVTFLDERIQSSQYDEIGASDFALFGSGRQVLLELYGVGFIGLEDKGRGGFVFCHDGSRSEFDSFSGSLQTVVHPCYWKALALEAESSSNEFMVKINDEYDTKSCADVKDLRTKQLGRIIDELPKVKFGKEGSSDFEDWVFRTIRILFSGKLSNPEIKPNPGAIQQRDIVATNMARDGFWKRIREDYGTRQVIFEVKNFDSLKIEDYRQVLSYTTGDYGRFAIIITRSVYEGVDEVERDWIREMWHSHQRLIFTIPAPILARCLSKLRNVKRFDYAEDALGKRLDTFVRSYLSLKHEGKYRRRKKHRN